MFAHVTDFSAFLGFTGTVVFLTAVCFLNVFSLCLLDLDSYISICTLKDNTICTCQFIWSQSVEQFLSDVELEFFDTKIFSQFL